MTKDLKADFEQVAIPHLPSLYTAALYLTKDEHEAEDLVQETYLRAYRFFHKFEAGTNCRAWLLSIQRRLFINGYRQKNTQPKFLDWEKIDQECEMFGRQGNYEKRDSKKLNVIQDKGVGV